MKYILILTLLTMNFFQEPLFSQNKNVSTYISNNDLIGTWQRNSKVIGSGLNQNFEFFTNRTFILHLGSDADDVRNTIELRGKYRIENDKLFFTILSRTIVDGNIGILDKGVSLGIFEVIDSKPKVVQESNSKEIPDPCYITIISKTNIKLGNEIYYKVK
jgi:hypothetical protein